MKKAEREEILRQRMAEMLQYEKALREKGIRLIGGADEAGRGPMAGPVVAACVVLPEDFDVLGIDDSKKLTAARRERLFGEIAEKAEAVGIGTIDHGMIDEINILQAARRAMTAAAEEARRILNESGKELEHLLIDAMTLEGFSVPQTGIVKGDAKSLSIAAASIVAKVTRDRMMLRLHEAYPVYRFDKNKGYGTAEHCAALRQYGPCPVHRRTFLKNCLQSPGEAI